MIVHVIEGYLADLYLVINETNDTLASRNPSDYLRRAGLQSDQVLHLGSLTSSLSTRLGGLTSPLTSPLAATRTLCPIGDHRFPHFRFGNFMSFCDPFGYRAALDALIDLQLIIELWFIASFSASRGL